MEPTFDDLGMPFPLFEAPCADAADVRIEDGDCMLCGLHVPVQFDVRLISAADADVPTSQLDCDALAARCRVCNALSSFVFHDGRPTSCSRCSRLVEHPVAEAGDGALSVCYGCLRGGRVALSKDTRSGPVALGALEDGLTNGGIYLGLTRRMVSELLRTPRYGCMRQRDTGCNWHFYCGQPMIYVGSVTRERPDLLRALHSDFLGQEPWNEDAVHHALGLGVFVGYAFRCARCGAYESDSQC